jgi:putative endonuclease
VIHEVGPSVALAKEGNMFYVYILKLKNGDYYIGYTDDLKRRLEEHQSGQVATTKRYLPLELVSYFAFKSKKKALSFERYLKTGSGFAFRNRHLV